MKKIVLILALLSVLVLPVVALAQPDVTDLDLENLITSIESTIWVVFGLIVVIAFVVAGILFLSAGGAPEKVQAARSAFVWGVVGVIVGILAYSIIEIVSSFFQ